MNIAEFILMLSGAMFWTAFFCLVAAYLAHMYLGDDDE